MFLLTHPHEAKIGEFLEYCRSDTFSYREVGESRFGAPAGYNVDHTRVKLGNGQADLERAKDAIRRWRMFEVPGLELFFRDTPIEACQTVAPLALHLGFYSLNACRIVYVIEEPDRFGFAYGTLHEHAETGEERFMVEIDRESGDVHYDVFAFSRPKSLLVKLGYPYSRYRQKQFSRGSAAAMMRAMNRKQGPQ